MTSVNTVALFYTRALDTVEANVHITTAMCDGVLHYLWFVSNVFLVSLHGD